jgi:hypothetical protein
MWHPFRELPSVDKSGSNVLVAMARYKQGSDGFYIEESFETIIKLCPFTYDEQNPNSFRCIKTGMTESEAPYAWMYLPESPVAPTYKNI